MVRRLELATLGYKPSALAIELTNSKASAVKELSLSNWCIASLHIYHFSTVVDFSSERYSASTGHRNHTVVTHEDTHFGTTTYEGHSSAHAGTGETSFRKTRNKK